MNYYLEEEEEENDWSLYIVAGYDPYFNNQVTENSFIYTTGYDEAMDIYEVLLRLSIMQ